MLLWTSQTTEAYNTLIHTGAYHCNESKIIDFEWWKPAYDWIAQKMKEQIGDPPEGVNYPVWLWYRWKGKNKNPP